MLATRHLCGRTFNGTESENLERENCDLQLKTSASKWETEHTMLQFVALTDAEGETRVIIALVKKYYKRLIAYKAFKLGIAAAYRYSCVNNLCHSVNKRQYFFNLAAGFRHMTGKPLYQF